MERFTSDGKPINDVDFFEIKIYSLKLSKEFKEAAGVSSTEGTTSSDDDAFRNILKDATNVTKQLITNADLLQIDQLHDTLYLPIPNNISESFSHEYDEDKMNIGEMARDAVFNTLTAVGTPGKVVGVLKDIGDLALQVMNRSNVILDPRMLLVYKSTNPRSFEFDFNIMPHSQDESNYYKKVIDVLKSYSKAEEMKLLGFIPALKQDKIFTFNFGGLKNKNSLMNDLMRTDDTEKKTPGFFISSVSLTINNDGNYIKTYHDGMPIQMSLKLTFKERKPLYHTFWNDPEVKQTEQPTTTASADTPPEPNSPQEGDPIVDVTPSNSVKDEDLWWGM